MRKLHRIFITGISIVTFLASLLIIWILLFHQQSVPKLSTIIQRETISEEQIKEAVKEYLRENPPEPGKDGNDGSDAPPVFDYQIDRSVGAYLLLHPPEKGAKGDTVVGDKGTSCSTSQVEGGALISCEDGTSSFIANGRDGGDGRTPYIQCNTKRNRWEIRYSPDENWVVLADQEGNSVTCTRGKPAQ